MVNILGKWLSLSVAFWAAESLLPGVSVTGDAFTYVVIAFIFGIVNVTAGNLFRLFTLPMTLLTLGLWSIVVNALMLLATDSFSDALFVDGFWWALAGALVIGFASSVVNKVFSSLVK
jgi:putative membrane protein